MSSRSERTTQVVGGQKLDIHTHQESNRKSVRWVIQLQGTKWLGANSQECRHVDLPKVDLGPRLARSRFRCVRVTGVRV
jgi:hypothetical protein